MPAAAGNSAPLEVITFPGTGSLVHFVGADKGFYERAGIEVNVTPTPNSVFQITNLVAGKFDIASTAIDNVVAYQEGQGAAELERDPDIFVFMGGAQIELTFTVAADIASFDDLRGKTLAVDALSTGFAFILYRMLENAGLGPDDYTLVSVGGTDKRWESLKAGEHAGTLLNDPFTSFAMAAGFRNLESSRDTLAHYQSGIFAACRSWAEANGDRLTTFIGAHLELLEWTLDPANVGEVAEILAKHMPALAPEAARAAVDRLVSPLTGFTPRAGLDMDGIDTVLALRSQYGVPQKSLTDAAKYLDLSYYRAALGSP